jgi:uncharacterized caspase-like protein
VLLAGVSHYPLLGHGSDLAPAANDLRNLHEYIEQNTVFDDVIELTEEKFTAENLRTCLVAYIKPLVKSRKGTRFLFLYSGHGFAEGPEGREHGYLLTSKASSFEDDLNSVDLSDVRVWMSDVLDNAFQSLVLINSCYSGAFFNAPFGRLSDALMSKAGAHAITASGGNENAFDDPDGDGSIFFDAFLEAVEKHRAQTYTADVITVNELYTYISARIASARDGQTPRSASLKPALGGGYFFPLKEPTAFTRENMEKAQPAVNPVAFGVEPSIQQFEVSPGSVAKGAVLNSLGRQAR